MKPIRVTAIILVLLSGLYCQQPTCRYSVPVNVTDAKTFEPLIGFGTASFQIHIGKQTLKPTAVAYRRAQRVFLFVDASGSMRSKPGRWAVVMQAAHEILATINTSVPIETEIFAESGQSFSNREEASAFLKYLYDKATKVPPLGNRTELYDDIASAVESEHIGIDDAVIIITDGGDNQSKLDESKLKRELAAHAIHPAFLLLPAESNFPARARGCANHHSPHGRRTRGLCF
ncbi:MAG TPA: hypothetical protein VFU86_19440 [Terriglobales bacterium]|nr:hypothetical protein [Terriglobales bacterium]